MAFIDAQKVKIRSYLGYPNLNRFRDTRLENAIEVIGADSASQTEAETILDEIAAVDALLASDSGAIQSAGLKRAEDIEWYPAGASGGTSAPMVAISSRGRQWIGRLSTLMGIPIWGDYYGTRGYAGDGFMGVAHQYGQNLIRMG